MPLHSESKIDFKMAQTSDLPELAEWIKRYYAYDHIEYQEMQVRQGLWNLLENEALGTTYFVSQNDRLIGYFILTYSFDIEFGGQHGVLTDLFFDEEARRSGIGTKTLEFIEQLCLKLGFSCLLLQVGIDNLKAQTFYQKAGITTLARHILVKDLKDLNS